MLPTVTGILTAAEVSATLDSIAGEQLPSGLIPWARGVHGDAWNHTEAIMALALGGRHRETERAYQWLLDAQRPDGSWHQYYLGDSVEDSKLDANTCAYPAAGVWHQWLLTRDRGFIETMWPMVERAIDFVLDLQTPRGEIRWARHVDGTAWPFALLTGSSSISHSLRCAIALAEELGHERPDWELSVASLVRTIHHVPEAFQPKERWAMDWYYPVLVGVLRCEEARQRLDDEWDRFVMPGLGVRCVSDRPWVTAAETCECALALLAAEQPDRARQLFGWAQRLRTDDGSYLTGDVHPQGVSYPDGERSTYTAAAVVLAADALSRTSPASGLFVDHDLLPAVVDFEAELDLD
ncbi:MAG: prenyltransferase [Acidimicrobiia bacterium]